MVKNGKEINTLKGHSASVNSLAYLSDGSISVIKIWNNTSGQESFALKSHYMAIYSLCHLGNDLLASGAFDACIKIWNVKT